jgi:hypothetical protein
MFGEILNTCILRRTESCFRIFMYPISPEAVTYNLAATAVLFEPVLTEEFSS